MLSSDMRPTSAIRIRSTLATRDGVTSTTADMLSQSPCGLAQSRDTGI